MFVVEIVDYCLVVAMVVVESTVHSIVVALAEFKKKEARIEIDFRLLLNLLNLVLCSALVLNSRPKENQSRYTNNIRIWMLRSHSIDVKILINYLTRSNNLTGKNHCE